MACMRDVLKPYKRRRHRHRSRQRAHHEAMIAGTPAKPASPAVSPAFRRTPAASSTTRYSLQLSATRARRDDVHTLCWTASQEIAHAFGLAPEMY
jgi:hypothetical protein